MRHTASFAVVLHRCFKKSVFPTKWSTVLSLFLIINLIFMTLTSAGEYNPKLIIGDQISPITIMTKNDKAYIKVSDLKQFSVEVSEEINGSVTVSTSKFSIEIDSVNQMANFKGKIDGLSFPAGICPMTTFVDQGQIWVSLKEFTAYLGLDVKQLGKLHYLRVVDGSEKLTDAMFIEKITGIKVPVTKVLPSTAPKKTAAPITPNKPQNNKPKVVYLTFDDGPGGSTEEILNLLNKYDMKATFFMLNYGIENNPESVKKIIKEGHALGLHGVTHRIQYFYKTATSPLSEMNTTNATLKKTVGKTTHLIRTPYGSRPKLTKAQYANLKKAGYILWDWNVDSQDSAKNYVNPKVIFNNTVYGMQMKSRPIVLLHDKKCTAESLESILKWMKENNYTSEALDEQMPFLNWME